MKLGTFNYMRVMRFTSVGAYLADKDGDEILLPNKYIPEDLSEDDEIKVFVYKDSEDRPIATTLHPKAAAGEFAVLQVKAVNSAGAFLDWGLEKDLLLPYREQKTPVQPGDECLIYVSADPRSGRLVASSRIELFTEDKADLKPGQEVEVLISGSTPLGYNAIINNRYRGLLYKNEVFQPLKMGDRKKAFVKHVREDGKVDLSLQKQGYEGIEPGAEEILRLLEEKKGFLALTDKSDPEEIYHLLHMSKKTFKKAIGHLYKQRLIDMDESGIKLIK